MKFIYILIRFRYIHFKKSLGRQVIAVGRTCNLILIVLDAAKPMTHKRIIEKELEGFGIRLNQKPPSIIFKKKERGG
jgi:ribosome-interacting GTPase 1